MSSPKLPKLFVSFTGTLFGLQQGHVLPEDLAIGLFSFGCKRVQVLSELESLASERPDPFAPLLEAVTRAEAENRIRFYQDDDVGKFQRIDLLLEANGFKPLANPEKYQESDFSYEAVAARSSELEVFI